MHINTRFFSKKVKNILTKYVVYVIYLDINLSINNIIKITIMKQKKEKMVLVAGVMVPESKVAGRLNALANGCRIHNEMTSALKETRQDEVRQMREAGWKEDEITQHFLQENAETAASHGFIRPARVFRAPKVNFGPGVMFH